jgi:hypothetical protein
MAISFSGGRSRSTQREPPTMCKQLVNLSFAGASWVHPFCNLHSRARTLAVLANQLYICQKSPIMKILQKNSEYVYSISLPYPYCLNFLVHTDKKWSNGYFRKFQFLETIGHLWRWTDLLDICFKEDQHLYPSWNWSNWFEDAQIDTGISIFSNGRHIWRWVSLSDTILKGNYQTKGNFSKLWLQCRFRGVHRKSLQ